MHMQTNTQTGYTCSFTCITISSNTREKLCDIVSTEVAIQDIVAFSLCLAQWTTECTVHNGSHRKNSYGSIPSTSPLISYNFPPAHFSAVQLFCSYERWSMCFGLVERWQRELGGNRVVSTEWEDLRTIISSFHGTSFVASVEFNLLSCMTTGFSRSQLETTQDNSVLSELAV